MRILDQLSVSPVNAGGCAGPERWVHEDPQHRFDSFNPATGEAIASITGASLDDYETIVTHACRAQKEWRMVPAPKRGELVRLIGEQLREYKDALGTLVSMEMGKIKQEGDGEVQEMIDIADFAVGQSRMLYGKTMHSERPMHRMYEQWHPLGVIGVITAFNFPVAVWAWNALIAAVAGNTVVWRPSPKTPLCAIAVQQICNRVMAAQGLSGIFNLLIEPDLRLVSRLVLDQRLPLISFTGSTDAGRQVDKSVSARLGRCLLELSGNNAVILDASADLDLAVPAVVFGAVGTSGQRCTTTRRLIVHKDIYADVVERLAHAYRQIKIGDPLDPHVLMGPLIDEPARTRYLQALDSVRGLGGEMLYAGHDLEGPGYFVSPSIVGADNAWDIVQRETFGPLLYVMPFATLDEAMAIHNGVPQGLSSSLFTQDLKHAEQFLSAAGSDCGIANINIGTSGAEVGGAFGGEKETGGGREAGSDAWQAYMRRQTNTINWGRELPLAQGIRFDLK